MDKETIAVRAQDDALVEMGDCNAVFTGKWTKATSPRAYNNSYSYARCTGTDRISKEINFDSSVYGVTATSTSSYSVYVHWAGHPSATTDAHYRIFDGPNQVGVCTMNQSSLTGEWRSPGASGTARTGCKHNNPSSPGCCLDNIS